MLVFSDLSLQLLINWLGRCATPFDSEHLILTSTHQWALDLWSQGSTGLAPHRKTNGCPLGLCKEQSLSSGEHGWGWGGPGRAGAPWCPTQEHTCCTTTGGDQPEPPCLPYLSLLAAERVCSLHRGGSSVQGANASRCAPGAPAACLLTPAFGLALNGSPTNNHVSLRLAPGKSIWGRGGVGQGEGGEHIGRKRTLECSRGR